MDKIRLCYLFLFLLGLTTSPAAFAQPDNEDFEPVRAELKHIIKEVNPTVTPHVKLKLKEYSDHGISKWRSLYTIKANLHFINDTLYELIQDGISDTGKLVNGKFKPYREGNEIYYTISETWHDSSGIFIGDELYVYKNDTFSRHSVALYDSLNNALSLEEKRRNFRTSETTKYLYRWKDEGDSLHIFEDFQPSGDTMRLSCRYRTKSKESEDRRLKIDTTFFSYYFPTLPFSDITTERTAFAYDKKGRIIKMNKLKRRKIETDGEFYTTGKFKMNISYSRRKHKFSRYKNRTK